MARMPGCHLPSAGQDLGDVSWQEERLHVPDADVVEIRLAGKDMSLPFAPVQ
jgi:hypothetical protein